jgi:hypothetical protein
MIRGAFDVAGVAKLPAPIGGIFVIPTNVGEWHVLTQSGFYLTRLFQGDPLKVRWPAQAVPGADMSDAPPGLGGEDFGGSIAQGPDGTLHVQAGKTGFWNLDVTGLESVRGLRGGTVTIGAQDIVRARALKDAAQQARAGTRTGTAVRLTPTFTGVLDRDFAGAEILRYGRQEDAAVRTAVTWDDRRLYVGWEVQDNTPWINSATDPVQLYLGGDTVDLQLGVDPTADPNRAEAASGDLRVSIGPFQGKPTAVLYRKVSDVKKPRAFSSGVVKAYAMDYVSLLPGAAVTVTVTANRRYVVEASIPLSDLGLTPRDGLAIRGDVGCTHGDVAGSRTRLRSYWNNRHTGIVDDAVFELQMEPRYWGLFLFQGSGRIADNLPGR